MNVRQILSPGKYYMLLPVLIYGCITVVSGLLATLLPETKDTKLPDTIQESEKVELNTNCCSCKSRGAKLEITK